jgi:RND family efflux transporter MFP subunit
MSNRIFILFVAAITLSACSDGSDAGDFRRGGGPSEAVGVIAREIVLEREAESIEALGTARARASAIIFAETAGEVAEVRFSAGDRVEAGAVLIQLEAAEERLAVRLSQVAVREAEQLLARYRRIEGTGAVSDSQIDEAETALEAARIESEQASLALQRRTVSAPFSGYVGLTEVDAGARVTTTTEIARLDDRSVLFVDFAPSEQVFGRIQVGDVVQATPFAGDDRSYEARIVNVDTRINPQSRTFTVRAQLDNASDQLRPGMSFRVGFELLSANWPVVPEVAISWGSDGAYVWIVREGVARREAITLIQCREGRVLVSGDFTAGELVVAEGVQRMREGAPVNILEVREAGAGLTARSLGAASAASQSLAQ